MSNPTVHRFQLPGSNDCYTISNDVVDYIEPARPFGQSDLIDAKDCGRFQTRMIAIPDRQHDVVTPMVMTLGNQGGLHLIRQSTENSSGWEKIDLNPAIAKICGANPHVSAFGAAWTADGEIAVAVAVYADAQRSESHVLVAHGLKSTSDWLQIKWEDCGKRTDESSKVCVDAIRVLRDGNRGWIISLAAEAGRPGMVTYLLHTAWTKRTFKDARVVTPGSSYAEISCFEAAPFGTMNCAMHILGKHADNTPLFGTRVFPRWAKDGTRLIETPPNTTLPVPPGANVLKTGMARQYGADIYIGGKGVHLISSDQFFRGINASVEVVIPPEEANDIIALVVADQGNGNVSVWALERNGDLLLTTRPEAAAPWSPMARIRSGIRDIAPVCGDSHVTTSILVLDAHGTASFLWRDGNAGGVWQETPIHLADQNEAAKIPSFGTTLRVLDQDDAVRAGVQVTVTASLLSSVVINGISVFVGPNLPVKVATGLDGAINLFNRADTFTPAIYRFAIEGASSAIDVNPAAPVFARFRTMNASDLLNAKLLEGGKDEMRKAADVATAALKQAAELLDTRNELVPGVRAVVDQKAALGAMVRADALADSYSWGMRLGDGGLKALEKKEIQELTSRAGATNADLFSRMGSTLSDFCEGVWQGLKDAASFVVRKVKDGVEFIVEIAGKVKAFVIEKLEQLGAFFKSVWNSIGVAIGKVWEYLKFLFNWGDILKVKRILKETVRNSIRDISNDVAGLKATINKGFDTVEEELVKLSPSGTGFTPTNRDASAPAKPDPKDRSLIDSIMGSAPVNWVTGQFGKLAGNLVTVDLPEMPNEKWEDNIDLQWEKLKDMAAGCSADLKAIIDDKPLTLNNFLGLDTLKALVVALGARLMQGSLNLIRGVALALVDAIVGLVNILESILFTTIRFPFIEKLAKLMGGNLDTSFQLIDLVALPAAILATIGFKVFTGKSPAEVFANDTPPDQSNEAPIGKQSVVLASFQLLSDIASSCVSLIKTLYHSIHAAMPTKAAKEAGKLDWIGFAFGACLHFFNPPRAKRATSTAYDILKWLSFSFGLYHTAIHFYRLRKPGDLVADKSGYTNSIMHGVDGVFEVIRIVLDTVAYAIDGVARDGKELLAGIGKRGSAALLHFAHAVENPKAKLIMVGAAISGNLALNIGIGWWGASSKFSDEMARLGNLA